MDTQFVGVPPVRIPDDVCSWYRGRFFKPTFFGRILATVFGSPLQDPQIFAVLKPRPAYRYAAIDAWRRSLWHDGGLSRRTREAIAVAVSVANQCHY
jgi:hypothetical protein